MKNKESIEELINYMQTLDSNDLQFNVEAIEEAYQDNNKKTALPIKILSIFGGILASIAFLGFLFITELYESEFEMLLLGSISIGGSILLNKMQNRIILDTISVSFFIIGFNLLGLGLSKIFMNLDIKTIVNAISIIYILIALITLHSTANYILSLLSVIIINISILSVIIANNSINLIHLYISLLALLMTYIFLNEAKIIRFSKVLLKIYNPLRMGLILSLLSCLFVFGLQLYFFKAPEYKWMSSAVLILSILFLLINLFKILNVTQLSHKAIILIVSILLLAPSILSPGISGAIFIIILSFTVNNKTSLIIGIIAFIYFISQFYYDLNFNLLNKSILLFSSGILFILLYIFTSKKLNSNA